MADTIRAFIAADIPDHVLTKIRDVQENIRRCGFRIRWVRPENIHLTLKFLGDIRRQDVGRVGGAIVEGVKPFHLLSLSAGGVGVFPGNRRPRVLWVGLNGQTDLLVRLQRHLDNCLQPIGFQKEKRPFKGHLTIGRMKGRIELKKLADAIRRYGDFESGIFTLDRIHLYQSELKPEGAVYTRLSSTTLPVEHGV